MSADRLEAIRALIQQDLGGRGLRSDPTDNLLTRTAGDFEAACRSIAETEDASLAILTGFYIPTATPPAAETDGPLGAVFLARALAPLGISVVIVSDRHCHDSLQAGLLASGIVADPTTVPLLPAPPTDGEWRGYLQRDWTALIRRKGLNHLVALERVGPSHGDDRCYSMRGRDITEHTAPAHLLIEDAVKRTPRLATIGIGDGGNEIGMGKIPRAVIARNIPNGGKVACRVPTDHLIVAGVSNWGAYGLAAGVRLLRGAAHDPALFDPERERGILQWMVEKGPLVDGVTGKQEATVDGLPWEVHAGILTSIGEILAQQGGARR